MQNVDLIYRDNLRKFLFDLLAPVIKSIKQRNDLLTDEAMRIWIQAFTHESISEENYEDLEYLGDRMLKGTFAKYLVKKFPSLHKSDYNDLDNKYMNAIFQKNLSVQWGLNNFIRVGSGFTSFSGVEGDVLESFFGALETVADRIVFGLGLLHCYNVTEYFLSNTVIQPKIVGGSSAPPKTQVYQIFQRFGLSRPEEITTGNTVQLIADQDYIIKSGEILNAATNQDPKKAISEAKIGFTNLLIDKGILSILQESGTSRPGVNYKVKLTPAQMKLLQDEKINISNPIIADVDAATNAIAESEAYKRALGTLSKLGVTSSWSARVKRKKELSDSRLRPHLQKILPKLKSQGFTIVQFDKPKKTTNTGNMVMILQGVRDDDTTRVLGSIVADLNSPDVDINSKISLLEDYFLS